MTLLRDNVSRKREIKDQKLEKCKTGKSNLPTLKAVYILFL